MSLRSPIPFQKWIDDHRHLLKPPVGNQQVYENAEFIIMVVGGPNSRKDFHYNEGEEFFYQLEGDITLQVIDDAKSKEIAIRQGDIFLLPPKTPHSPQRPAGTVGLVIERKRRPGERDGLLWFCEECGNKLYEEYFEMTNIVTQMQPIFEKFYDSKELRTCQECKTVMASPT